VFPYLKFLSNYWQKERGKIALIFVLVVLSQSFSLTEPYFFAKIIDNFLRNAQNLSLFPTEAVFFKGLSLLVLGWIGVAFAARTFKNFQSYLVETVADRVGIRVFEQAYKHLLALPMAFHSRQKSGEVFRKLSKARDDITSLFSIFYDKIFQNIFTISVILIIVLIKSWRIGIPLFGFVPVFFFITWFFTKKIKKTQLEINKINEGIFGSSFEAVSHVELVKSFSTEKAEEEKFRHDNALSHKILKKKTFAFQSLGFAQGTVVNLARVVLLWYGTLLAFQGQLSFGDVILFNFYSFYIYQPLYELGGIYTKYHEGIAAVDRLDEVLREPVSIKDKPGAIKVEKLQGKLEFKDVSFAYEPGGRQILKNISFVLEPGRKLALVGISGSGKSTIVKLLFRFYEPVSGEIFIDNRPIEDYDSQSLRKRLGLVLQDTVLFNTSIADNIRYGTFEASDEKVKSAAKKSSLQNFISKLSEGIKTVVGERGLKVSGGEKQRIAIARSIIKEPDILVFDEATSALDSHTEEEIRKNITEVSAGITSVVVAHRFATVVDADEIILLKDGEIFERGNHQQLILQKGEYARIYNLQTQRQHAEEELAGERV